MHVRLTDWKESDDVRELSPRSLFPLAFRSLSPYLFLLAPSLLPPSPTPCLLPGLSLSPLSRFSLAPYYLPFPVQTVKKLWFGSRHSGDTSDEPEDGERDDDNDSVVQENFDNGNAPTKTRTTK